MQQVESESESGALPETGSPRNRADNVLACLRLWIEDLLVEIRELEAWKAVTDPATDPSLVQAAMREVYMEIALYQPDVIEASIAIIGQFPRTVKARRVQAMLVHQAEEWDHGEMALRDFVGLGGIEGDVRTGSMTETAFATAAFWRFLVHKRRPFAYLGALYLLEALTPIVTGLVRKVLRDKGLTDRALEFIDFHATEDIRHTRIMEASIRDSVEQFPDADADVLFGFRAFRHVYPIPGWNAAVARANRQDTGGNIIR
jgi:hypothetical protein